VGEKSTILVVTGQKRSGSNFSIKDQDLGRRGGKPNRRYFRTRGGVVIGFIARESVTEKEGSANRPKLCFKGRGERRIDHLEREGRFV